MLRRWRRLNTKDLHALTSRSCEWVTLQCRRDFARVTKSEDPEMKKSSWIIGGWGNVIMRVPVREGRRVWTEGAGSERDDAGSRGFGEVGSCIKVDDF